MGPPVTTQRINIKGATSCWVPIYPSALLLFVHPPSAAMGTNCSVSWVQMLQPPVSADTEDLCLNPSLTFKFWCWPRLRFLFHGLHILTDLISSLRAMDWWECERLHFDTDPFTKTKQCLDGINVNGGRGTGDGGSMLYLFKCVHSALMYTCISVQPPNSQSMNFAFCLGQWANLFQRMRARCAHRMLFAITEGLY